LQIFVENIKIVKFLTKVIHNEPVSSQEYISQVFVTLICIFSRGSLTLKLKFQSSNFDNLKKFLFKVATTIMNGHQRFLPGKLAYRLRKEKKICKKKNN
jgi:hypothetical protein